MPSFLESARIAAEALRPLFEPTPLQRNDYLSNRYDADIWLKREDLTPVRSYKIRGAVNAMRKALEADPGRRLFVCASAGNHAQGVAYACRHFGVKGVIFMPVTTPGQKIDKTRTFGGDQVEIKLFGDIFDRSLDAALQFCAAEGGHFLAPFDDDDVIEGQASVGIEMLDQLGRAPDVVVMPVGGGGLSSGLRQVLAGASEEWFVEPEGGRSLHAALLAGAPVALPSVDNFVDGAAVAKIGAVTFTHLSDLAPERVLGIPEDRLSQTMIEMLNIEGIVLEPAGALAVDALRDLGAQIKGRTVVCITSGGNFDFERLPDVKERSLRWSGLKKYFILRLPQRPGALRDFLHLLGPDDDVTRFEYLKKSARNFGSVLLGIETTDPENFERLYRALQSPGFDLRDITMDETLAGVLV